VMASEAYHICQMLVIYLMLQIQVLGKYRFPVSKYEIYCGHVVMFVNLTL
jgi:hypothetical protein